MSHGPDETGTPAGTDGARRCARECGETTGETRGRDESDEGDRCYTKVTLTWHPRARHFSERTAPEVGLPDASIFSQTFPSGNSIPTPFHFPVNDSPLPSF